MLNLDLIDNLYAGLTKEQQQSLCEMLFKKSKQNMNYFRRTKDISLSKLETLADFFHMPLDYFRVNGSIKANNVSGDHNHVGNIFINSNLVKEIESLQRKVEDQNTVIASKEDTIKSKDDTIKAKEEMIALLKEQIEMLKAKTTC